MERRDNSNGHGSLLPPPALFLKVMFMICETQMEFSEEEACLRQSPLQKTEQDLLEIPTMLNIAWTDPMGSSGYKDIANLVIKTV